MRITGGIGKGRRLKVPAGSRVRPTSDKVKQALFNILGERIIDAVFLDLFTGAGGIGIEALSRGAEMVTFVDASRDSLNAVKQNVEESGYTERSEVILSKAESFLKKSQRAYDLVFLDPPYADELRPLLEALSNSVILKKDAIVIAEHFKKQSSPPRARKLTLYRQAKYGDTVLAFYKIENFAE